MCLRAQDAALIAALVRALVETEARAWRSGQPVRPVRAELLRLAAWGASRSGLESSVAGVAAAAAEVTAGPRN